MGVVASCRKAMISPRSMARKRKDSVSISTCSPLAMRGSIESPETTGAREKKIRRKIPKSATCRVTLAAVRMRETESTLDPFVRRARRDGLAQPASSGRFLGPQEADATRGPKPQKGMADEILAR